MHFFIIINATPEKSRIGNIAVFLVGIRFPCINYYLYLSAVKAGVHFFSAEGETAMQRCGWVSQDPLYIEYHDTEWGVAQKEGRQLFEMICLEGQQAGLSWITVLKKRQNYRQAFHQFDPVRVAAMGDDDIERLLQDTGIIRH
ncbi:DNA-3-methyladenine glycosylase I, partial [Klebsiella pneumoniae]